MVVPARVRVIGPSVGQGIPTKTRLPIGAGKGMVTLTKPVPVSGTFTVTVTGAVPAIVTVAVTRQVNNPPMLYHLSFIFLLF